MKRKTKPPMWRLLPLCLLSACAATDPATSTGPSGAQGEARIVRTAALTLGPPTSKNDSQPANRTFQTSGTSGWVDAQGAWQIRSEVEHRRLRCAVYQVGAQLGLGSPGCSSVEWLTGLEYVTRERHCNNAARIHSGVGRFADIGNTFDVASCVQVVVSCEGAC